MYFGVLYATDRRLILSSVVAVPAVVGNDSLRSVCGAETDGVAINYVEVNLFFKNDLQALALCCSSACIASFKHLIK